MWEVTATFEDQRIAGTARTQFRFGDFNLEIPRLAFMMKVQDSIRLEYDFALER